MIRWVTIRRVGLVVATVVAGCTGSQSSDQALGSSLIEVRLVRQEGGGGVEAVEYAGERIYVDSEPLLSDSDFERVEPVIRSGEFHLEFELRPDAGARVSEVTAAEIGERLAVIVDSEVRSVSVILDAVGPRGRTSFLATSEEAEGIAEKVRRRWP